MSGRENDFDLRLMTLEKEWGMAYEASRNANAHLETLSTGVGVESAAVAEARRRLEQAEALKAQVLAKIEHLEVITTRRFGALE